MNHGGNLHDAKALFPEAPAPWLDLSTGINPTPYPFEIQDPDAFTRLPSRQSVDNLERIAARAYGESNAERVTAASGTQALIELMPRLRKKSRVVIVGPTYNEHEACWHRQGHQCLPAVRLSDALSASPDVIVVVNPNNPDGRVIGFTELAGAASELSRRGGWLVVDEAFADLEESVSVAGKDLPSTVILRSFGKTYGLAGLRLGFAMTDTDLAERIRAELGLWSVSGPALVIGAAALADTAWLEAQRTALKASADALDVVLIQSGFAILGGTRLFRLARHKKSAEIFEMLARAGIWVRKFPYDSSILRFGVPSETDLRRLSGALNPALSA